MSGPSFRTLLPELGDNSGNRQVPRVVEIECEDVATSQWHTEALTSAGKLRQSARSNRELKGRNAELKSKLEGALRDQRRLAVEVSDRFDVRMPCLRQCASLADLSNEASPTERLRQGNSVSRQDICIGVSILSADAKEKPFAFLECAVPCKVGKAERKRSRLGFMHQPQLQHAQPGGGRRGDSSVQPDSPAQLSSPGSAAAVVSIPDYCTLLLILIRFHVQSHTSAQPEH